MALEDRVSPQSAPSPPGVPHSPQSTASPTILDMSLHAQRLHSPYHAMENQTNVISAFSQKLSPPVLHDDDDEEDEEIVIKEEEENDSLIMDEQDQHERMPNGSQSSQIPSISFSIMNILSDRFGQKKCMPEKKSATIFRPFEISRRSPPPQPVIEKSAFTRLIPEVIDYSRPLPPTTVLPNPLLLERANFLNCFNPATYPRIHEEILNSRRGGGRSNDLKIPPLGSLCKTVSQIGQTALHSQQSHCLASPPPSSSMSSSSASSTSASPASGCRVPPLNSAASPQPTMPGAAQSVNGRDSGMESSDDTRSESGSSKDENGQQLWPAWVYCTRYSDRPSSGPRYRRPKKPKDKTQVDEKRPRTAFSSEQLARLKHEFNENRYLTERRRQQLSSELGLNEAQIKIWFQNKRAKIKKASGTKNPLALQLMAQGLYNHSTVPLTKEEEELEMRMNGHL